MIEARTPYTNFLPCLYDYYCDLRFVKNITKKWKEWNLDTVSLETTKVSLPISTHSGQLLVRYDEVLLIITDSSSLSIIVLRTCRNSMTNVTMKKVTLDASNSAEVAYSVNGIATGRLAYAHFGLLQVRQAIFIFQFILSCPPYHYQCQVCLPWHLGSKAKFQNYTYQQDTSLNKPYLPL